jgi:hypothetical protein
MGEQVWPSAFNETEAPGIGDVGVIAEAAKGSRRRNCGGRVRAFREYADALPFRRLVREHLSRMARDGTLVP